MFPYLILFPDIFNFYFFTFANNLTQEQFYLLIPKIENKLKSKEEEQKYIGVAMLDSYPIDETTDLSIFTKTDIIPKMLEILENETFPSFPQYTPVFIIRFLSNFFDHFSEMENEKAIRLLYKISFELIDSKDINEFIIHGSCVYRALEALSKLPNFKKMTGGREYMSKMNEFLKENQEAKFNVVYNLISFLKFFEDNLVIDNMDLSAPMMNCLIQQIGNRLESDETLDSSWTLIALLDLFGKEMYPWLDLFMTKSINVLKKEKANSSVQISFILMGLNFFVSIFPDFVEKYYESSGCLDLILFYSLVNDSCLTLRNL
jgi:hypothetical protein